MIDIHCHILPNVDDGSSSMEESMEMARMALYSGITAVVATPHFLGEPESLEQLPLIDRAYRELKKSLMIWDIPLRLHKGAEILCTKKTSILAAERKLPTLSNTRYVLTEFYFDETFEFIDDCLAEISYHGYRPVIAHPERYAAIQQDPLRARHWVNHNFVLQLNKGSVLGAFGSHAQQCANDLLELGLVHLFASDAHGCITRTPQMTPLLEWAEEYCDPVYTRILLEENPQRILRDIHMAGVR
jgi:protein-tyrosine phosphatase